MNFSVPMSHRQRASEDFRGMSEGMIRALGLIKQAKDDEENRADRALARQVSQSQLAASQQQQQAGAIQLRGAQEEERLLGSMTDFDSRQATPGAFGPELPEEAAIPSPLSNRGRGEVFKDTIISQLRTRRNPGAPVTPEDISKERMDKDTSRTREADEFGLRKGQITAATKASEASTVQSAAETARIKKETELLGTPKPADLAKVADGEDGMRREFTGLNKSYAEVVSALGRVKASAENPSAAGDMSLIFAYMKMLDPTSTVREGEQAQAEQARGVPASLVATYNKALAGTKLDDAQRKDFTDRASKLFEREEMLYENRAQQFTEIATTRGYNPKNIVLKYGPAAAGDAPVKVSTAEEYAKLAPGALYTDPKGVQRRKK